MKKSPKLDEIELGVDAVPLLTESVKTVGDLFDLINKALPSEQERIMRLGFNQVKIIAKSQAKASWWTIQKNLYRIRVKERIFGKAVKRGLPLDGIKSDLLELYNSIAD